MLRHSLGTVVLLAVLTSLAAGQSSFRDDFNSLVLQPGWSWIREDVSTWKLTGTHLEITTQRGALNERQYNNVRNLLLRSLPDSSFNMLTKLTFFPNNIYHNAGLVFYVDDDNYIRVSRGWSEFTNGVWFEYEIDGRVSFEFNPNVVENTVWLKLERKFINGKSIFASQWSIDGTHFDYISFGRELNFPTANVRVGLQAANGDGNFSTIERIPALFDYFIVFGTTGVSSPAAVPALPAIETVSPLPARSGRVTVSLRDVTEAAELSVVDLLGRTLVVARIDPSGAGVVPVALDLANAAPGAYRVVLRSSKGKVSRPLVIVR